MTSTIQLLQSNTSWSWKHHLQMFMLVDCFYLTLYVALENCSFLDEAYSFDLFLCQVNLLKGSSRLLSYASSCLFDSVNKKKDFKTT